jgi:hypothetical protein
MRDERHQQQAVRTVSLGLALGQLYGRQARDGAEGFRPALPEWSFDTWRWRVGRFAFLVQNA